MKKIYILIIAFLCNINAFSQDCDGITCVANPNVMQDKTVICYQEPLDSNSWCTPITNECYQVCENTYSTYSTTYNVGSTYSWIVTGGQLITTNTTGNIISVLWGPQGVGDVTVEESDTTGCSKIASACIDIITTPIASITNIPNTSTICQNTNIQFFGENLNRISHVGIFVDNETIVHAYGKVRMDKINSEGIYNNEEKRVTHFLQKVNRIL